MKIFILTFTLLLLGLVPVGAVKKFNANPVNLAVVIVEKGDSAKIKSFFDYYGYDSKGKEKWMSGHG